MRKGGLISSASMGKRNKRRIHKQRVAQFEQFKALLSIDLKRLSPFQSYNKTSFAKWLKRKVEQKYLAN